MLDEAEVNSVTEGFTGLIRLAWVTIGTLTKQTPDVTAVKATVEDDSILYLCLNRACDRDVFGFLNTHIFETAAFQVFLSSSCLIFHLAFSQNASCCIFRKAKRDLTV